MTTNQAPKISSKEELSLPRYYYTIQFSGIIVLAVLIAVFLWNKRSAQAIFISSHEVVLAVAVSLLVIHIILFILREATKKKFFWEISDDVWVFFWLVIIYVTGGVQSQYVYFLIFPPLVAASDFKEKRIKIVGIILTVGLVLMILTVPPGQLTGFIVLKQLVMAGIYGVIVYYIYWLVKEILRGRYERDIVKRRFAELSELNRIKDDFLKVAQHQLRTPLSGVRWALEGLRQKTGRQTEEKPILDEAAKKVDDAMVIVNEMLKTAEIGAVGVKFDQDPIDLGELTRRIGEELTHLIKKNHVSVSFSIAPGAKVAGDRKLLHSALTNVFDNAVRYSPNGKVSVDITGANKEVVAVFKDSGVGIAAEDLPYIFERFYRGQAAVSMEPNESGIGLYVAKKIIEIHKGTITIESKENIGTMVRISLPRYQG